MSNNLKTTPGKCLFCDGLGMTKQHLWPNWMNQVLPKPGPGAKNGQLISERRFMPFEKKPSVSEHVISLRPGAVGTRKLRLVCRECNNNWMSQIEDNSKEIIISLMNHEHIILTSEQQLKLIPWITLMAIMVEFTHISSKVIPVEERKYFLQNKLPPEDWVIWIGKYQGNQWIQRYSHKAVQFGDVPLTAEARYKKLINPPALTNLNFQTCVLVVGGLVMFVSSTSRASMKAEVNNIAPLGMSRIWPPRDSSINWETANTISDKEVNELDNVSTTIGTGYTSVIQSFPLRIL